MVCYLYLCTCRINCTIPSVLVRAQPVDIFALKGELNKSWSKNLTNHVSIADFSSCQGLDGNGEQMALGRDWYDTLLSSLSGNGNERCVIKAQNNPYEPRTKSTEANDVDPRARFQ